MVSVEGPGETGVPPFEASGGIEVVPKEDPNERTVSSVRFSESIRKDLSKVPVRAPDESRAEIASMILCAYSGRTGPGGSVRIQEASLPSSGDSRTRILKTSSHARGEGRIRILTTSSHASGEGRIRILTTSSNSCADRLVRLLREKQIAAEIIPVGKAGTELAVIADSAGHAELVSLADAFRAESITDNVTSSTRIRRAALRGAFMACGTAADPRRAYQIELHVKDSVFAHALMLILHAEDIEPSLLLRHGRNILYFKEGAQLGDFLAMIGAHISLLHFENIRTDKEIRNQVNRMVNCDTANAVRQAEAGARRGERLKTLLLGEEAARLPQELKDAAEVLIDNPGLSIKELGEMMDPPISKSGMHHRLRKLEKYAEETEG